MEKCNRHLVLLVTAVLLLALAGLPGLVAAVLDGNVINNAGYSPIQSVSLELSGQRPALSVAQKLILLRQNNTIRVKENQAAMTQEDVIAAVQTQMQEYVSAGIFEWFHVTSQTVTPFLCMDSQDPNVYNVFWSVSLINEEEPYQSLNLSIDDETGRIFSIRFDQYGSYSLKGVWERNYTVMETFSTIYLGQLGLTDGQLSAIPNIKYGELDGEVLWGQWSFTDGQYGDIPIEFYVIGTGAFYVYFPE